MLPRFAILSSDKCSWNILSVISVHIFPFGHFEISKNYFLDQAIKAEKITIKSHILMIKKNPISKIK
jgi:hypothetical protein